MCDVAVRAVDVWFSYPDGTEALRGVSFEVLKGEVAVILGPSGAGKSTILMHFAGLLSPRAGEVYVVGEKVSRRNVKEVRRRVGFVFQNPENQLFCPTLWDDVAFGPVNMGLPQEEVDRRVAEALEAVGLAGCARKHPHHLSFGEKRRAALATVLSMDPEVYLLDEPTANLDPCNAEFIVKMIRRLSGEGKTILVATHDVNVLPQIASKAIIMSEGTVLAAGPPGELLSDGELMGRAGLQPPIITRFFSRVHEKGILNVEKPYPISIEDAEQRVVQALRRRMGEAMQRLR